MVHHTFKITSLLQSTPKVYCESLITQKGHFTIQHTPYGKSKGKMMRGGDLALAIALLSRWDCAAMACAKSAGHSE
jgi:hypothetical protein